MTKYESWWLGAAAAPIGVDQSQARGIVLSVRTPTGCSILHANRTPHWFVNFLKGNHSSAMSRVIQVAVKTLKVSGTR
jgi:hypothetical protein